MFKREKMLQICVCPIQVKFMLNELVMKFTLIFYSLCTLTVWES